MVSPSKNNCHKVEIDDSQADLNFHYQVRGPKHSHTRAPVTAPDSVLRYRGTGRCHTWKTGKPQNSRNCWQNGRAGRGSKDSTALGRTIDRERKTPNLKCGRQPKEQSEAQQIDRERGIIHADDSPKHSAKRFNSQKHLS
jgi:hypothetical protein